MKVLLVDGDDTFLSYLAEELDTCWCEILHTFFGDGGLELYNKYGPWEFVLIDFRVVPGVMIKDGVQLLTAIRRINPLQEMAIMTSDPEETREKLPQALRYLPVLRKPLRVEQMLRLLRQPVLPFDPDGESLIGGRLSQAEHERTALLDFCEEDMLRWPDYRC